MTYNLKFPRFPQNVSLTALPLDATVKHELANYLAQAGLEAEDFNPQSLLEGSRGADENGEHALHIMLKAITYERTLPTVILKNGDVDSVAFWGNIETDHSVRNIVSPVILGGNLTLRQEVSLENNLYANTLHAFGNVHVRDAYLEQIYCREDLFATKLAVAGDVIANNIISYDTILVRGKIAAANDLGASHIVCASAFIGGNLYGHNGLNYLAFKAHGKGVVIGGTCHASVMEVVGGDLRAGRMLGGIVKVNSLNVVEDIELQTLVAKQALAKTVKVEGLYDVGTLECEELELGPDVKFGDKFYTGEPLAQQKIEEHHAQYTQTP